MRQSSFSRMFCLPAAGCVIACGVLSLAATSADAGMITGLTWHSGVASVAGDIINPLADPNNDDVAGTSPNSIQIAQKNYMAIGPVDIVLDVVDTGGVTEYLIIEGVFNGTGLDWIGYHLELGFGFGAGFVKSPSGDGLDFDAPDYNSDFSFGPAFPTHVVTEDDIIADGMLPSFAFAGGLLFHVDVPDGITSFTIRQSPIPVPEPGTFALLIIGAGLICRRNRRLTRA